MTKNVVEGDYAIAEPGTGGTWNSSQPNGVEPAPPQYAVGVPHPEDYFGYNPLTLAIPDDPAEWPSAENTEYYYIDKDHPSKTDVDNTYGYPDKPRESIPNGTYGTVKKMVIVAAATPYTRGSTWIVTFVGTVDNPVFIVGVGSPEIDVQFRLSDCRHVIIDDVNQVVATYNIGANGTNPCQYITLRNCTMVGPGTEAGGSTVSTTGNVSERTEYIVIYNTNISNFGDWTSGSENDRHGILPGAYSSYFWILGGGGSNMGGDSVQISQANWTGLKRPHHVYVAKNEFHHDRENAWDGKSAIDVVISENILHDYANSSSSAGEVGVIHDSAEYVWVINNIIYLGLKGISATSGSNLYMLGNEIRDMNGTVDFDAPYFEPNTGVGVTGIGVFGLAHNTFHNCIIAYASTSGSLLDGSEVSGNIFGERQNVAQGWDFMGESNSRAPDLVANYNVYDSFRGRISSTDYENLTTWRAATVYDDDSVEGDPLFVDEANDDFNLQAGSPAIGIVAVEHPAYALFETRYGIDIRFDINGNDVPVTDADSGAYQRIA